MKYKVVMHDGEELTFENVAFCDSAEDIVYLKGDNSVIFLAATANVKFIMKVE